MNVRYLYLFVVLLLAACSDTVTNEKDSPNVVVVDGTDTEKLVEPEEVEDTGMNEELSIEEILINAMLGSQAIDEFQGTTAVEKTVTNMEYLDEVKGKFETTYSMQFASEEAQEPLRIRYSQTIVRIC